MTPKYSRQFFADQASPSRRSATRVVPILNRLLAPRSVIDVGCGVGAWLAEFSAQGVTDVLGVDGDYVDRSALQIPAEAFVSHDLSAPLRRGRRFDLVLSLEVAEHLPPEAARTFVRTLTMLGPVVCFSAAIPGQGGVCHVNEQWQDYWSELFAAQGYRAVDCLRPLIWDDPAVDAFYAQNTIVYVDANAGDLLHRLAENARQAPPVIRIVHPRTFTGLAEHWADENVSVRRAAGMLFRCLSRAISRRVRGSERPMETPRPATTGSH